jgi:regulatory protein
MHQRLSRRDYDEPTITEVLKRLKADHYLSEARFAESYLRSRMKKGEAPWLAAQKARRKGADSAAVEAALSELTAHYDAEQAAREILAARDPAGVRFEDKRMWRRQARFLQNKGFASDIILRVLKEQVGDSR